MCKILLLEKKKEKKRFRIIISKKETLYFRSILANVVRIGLKTRKPFSDYFDSRMCTDSADFSS